MNIKIKIIPESEANKSAKNMLIANERGIREINNTKNLSCNSTFLKELMMSFMI